MHLQCLVRDSFACQFHEFPVVREKEQLRLLRTFGQGLEGCLGSSIIKVDKDVVYERQGLCGLHLPFQSRKAQCQEELIAGCLSMWICPSNCWPARWSWRR
jgi:hypothetical protein